MFVDLMTWSYFLLGSILTEFDRHLMLHNFLRFPKVKPNSEKLDSGSNGSVNPK
jgi:hypothetical protein